MATTTNYGWTTPDDTALVKDGAAAIRTLGTSVDTTTKALNPSTTLGDIEYRSSTADTNTRLGIGSTGQVLTVAGGVPSWATPAAGGAISSLASGSLNSGTSLVISSITQDFLQLNLVGITMATSAASILIRLNGSSSSVYDFAGGNAYNTPQAIGAAQTNNSAFDINGGSLQLHTNATNRYIITLQNCKSTGFTTMTSSNAYVRSASGNTFSTVQGIFKTAAQITSLTVLNSAGNAFNGTGTYELFGG
jgi:hypothetical protein